MSDDDPAPLPQIDAAQAVEVITGFIGAQMAQTGFGRLVVGLSGWVDSATTAFLAVRESDASPQLVCLNAARAHQAAFRSKNRLRRFSSVMSAFASSA